MPWSVFNFFAAAALALPVNVALSVRDEPCRLKHLGPDSSEAECTTVSQTVQICRRDHNAEQADIVVLQDKREVQRWTEPFDGFFTHDFQAAATDLDGDGIDEVLVATRNGMSNGMGVEYGSVCVVRGTALVSPPDCVAVEDYGFLGYFTKSPDSTTCRLLQTSWRWGKESGRGSGLYLVGRWLRYGSSGFLPEPSRPLIARRYLFSFAKERGSGYGSERPIPWFLDHRTRTVSCPDELCCQERYSEQPCTSDGPTQRAR